MISVRSNLVFAEVVATAGAVTQARQTTLMAIAAEAGFQEENVAFVTAYAERDDAAFKTTVSELAWRSFTWFKSEPDQIMALHRGAGAGHARLSELMER